MAQWCLQAQNNNLLCTDPKTTGKNEFVREKNRNDIHNSKNEKNQNIQNSMTDMINIHSALRINEQAVNMSQKLN